MLLTAKQYAKRHGVSGQAVRQKIRRGTLPARKIGRDWLIDDKTPYIDYRKNDEYYEYIDIIEKRRG